MSNYSCVYCNTPCRFVNDMQNILFDWTWKYGWQCNKDFFEVFFSLILLIILIFVKKHQS